MKIIKSEDNILLLLNEKNTINDEIKANAVDASFEKHVPQYNILGEKVEVFVNHVMEEEHYIEWILIDYGNEQIIKHFVPGDIPKIIVDYHDGMEAYSYCNKHSLWMNGEIK